MSRLFTAGHRRLQRQLDSERLADRSEQRLCRDHLTADDQSAIDRMDMFFLATADGGRAAELLVQRR